MASSTVQAFCNRRARMVHVSAAIIPAGTVIGVDKEGNEVKAPHNLVDRGKTYRKPKNDAEETENEQE